MQSRVKLSEVKHGIVEIERQINSINVNAKKNSGTYYTPDFIVRYMVDSALLNYLFPDLTNSDSLDFFEETALDIYFERKLSQNPQTAYAILNKLTTLKICDIAMGWGVFLIHALERLYLLYSKAINSIKQFNRRSYFLLDNDFERQQNKIITHIVSQNLYGADLSENAVKLARLKIFERIFAFLKTEEIVVPEPNFVVGNSLVGNNFSKEQNSRIKLNFSHNIQRELLQDTCINWNKEFPDVASHGGFDIIVGNPPYINVKKLPIKLRHVYKTLYSTYNSNGDISNVFIERSIQLSKPGGIISLITPRYWIEGHYSNSLREYLLRNVVILFIIDFRSNRSIFSKSEGRLGVDTLIFSSRKKRSKLNSFYVLISKTNSKINELKSSFFDKYKIVQKSLTKHKWVFTSSPIIDYLNETREFNLSDHSQYSGYEGVCYVGKGCSTGNNAIFTLQKLNDETFKGYKGEVLKLKERECETLRLLIKGKHIQKFTFSKGDLYWIFLKDKDIEQYPTINNYLQKYYARLSKTQNKYKTKNYYDYAAYRSLNLINHIPKIITPYQADSNRFAIVTEQDPATIYEADIITLVLKPEHRKNIGWYYLLAVLNSPVVYYYIIHMNKKIYNLYDFRPYQIANIPIISSDYNSLFEIFVRMLIGLKQQPKTTIDKIRYENILELLINYAVAEQYFENKTSSSLKNYLMESLDRNFKFRDLDNIDSNIRKHQMEQLIVDLVNDPKIRGEIKKLRKTEYVNEILNFLPDLAKLENNVV